MLLTRTGNLAVAYAVYGAREEVSVHCNAKLILGICISCYLRLRFTGSSFKHGI